MSLPSTIDFATPEAADNYIVLLNQLVADINLLLTQFNLTQLPSLLTASTASSVTIGTGSKTVTLLESSPRGYAAGTPLRIASAADPTKWVEGPVTAYSHPTLTIAAQTSNGSGSFADGRVGVGAGVASVLSLAAGAGSKNNQQLWSAATGAGVEWRDPRRDPVAKQVARAAYGGF